ncbi:helix-turn-helix domain-containing protein [Chitinimonas sp.]|uniref:helix-turn-helix domain-containing protein n=1 Tax=Chitinimonas sp. TaxID=1934313 RepID=UPI0035B3ED93
MSQASQLIVALKRILKARHISYVDVAKHLDLSHASVKRLFSQQRFSLATLEAICQLAGLELSDLVQEACAAPALHYLSAKQEAELVADTKLLLVTVCVLNHWSLAQILATYQLSEIEGLQALLRLDKLGLIRLMPENRVKLLVARDFAWQPDGPIHRFFRERIQYDFLDAQFMASDELLRFHHAMLSPQAVVRFKQRLARLLQEFAELHQDSHDAPERQGTSLLLALRSWEPAAFAALRRPGA